MIVRGRNDITCGMRWHERPKRQADKEEIAFQTLDKGVLACAKPRTLHHICDGLVQEEIGRVGCNGPERTPLSSRQKSGLQMGPANPVFRSQTDAGLRPLYSCR